MNTNSYTTTKDIINRTTRESELVDIYKQFINEELPLPVVNQQTLYFNQYYNQLKNDLKPFIKRKLIPINDENDIFVRYEQREICKRILTETDSRDTYYQCKFIKQYLKYVPDVLNVLIQMRLDNINTMEKFDPVLFLESIIVSYSFKKRVLPSDFIVETLNGMKNNIKENEVKQNEFSQLENFSAIYGNDYEIKEEKKFGNYTPFTKQDFYNKSIFVTSGICYDLPTHNQYYEKSLVLILFGYKLWIPGLRNMLRGLKNSSYKVMYWNMRDSIIRLAYSHPKIKERLDELGQREEDQLDPNTNEGFLRIMNYVLHTLPTVEYKSEPIRTRIERNEEESIFSEEDMN